jgi:hypothetical protein
MEAPERAEPSTPSLDDDPILKEDAAVAPALPASAYAMLGVHGFGRRRGSLSIRALRGLLTGAGPVLVTAAIAAFLWLLAMPRSGRLAVLGERPSVHALLTLAGDAVGGTPFVLLALLALGVPLIRGALDAALFGRLRDAWTPHARPLGAVLRRSLGAFMLLACVQAGLLVGGVMFLSPLVELLLRLLVQPSPPAAATFVLLVLAMGIVSVLFTLRFIVLVLAAHLAWRPRFVAATLASALAAPWVHWRTYLPIGLAWWWLSTSVLLGAAVVLASAGPMWLATGAVSVRSTVLLGLFAVSGTVIGAWLDAVLVAMVGHRLGDVGSGDEPSPLPEGAPAQARIILAPPGVFGKQPDAAYGATPPFRRELVALLGYLPTADPMEAWEVPAPLRALERVAAERSHGGGWELVLRGGAPPQAAEAAQRAVDRFSSLPLERRAYRSAGGALEVRFAGGS